MASIFKNKQFDSFGIEVIINKKRWRLYGFPNRREAVTFKDRLEELLANQKIGVISVPSKLWLAKLWENHREYYQRLVEMGLADSREECGTLAQLAEQYKVYAVNGLVPKDRTSIGRDGAYKSFLNFLANQKASNFKRDEGAIQKASSKCVNTITPEVATQFCCYMQKLYQPSTWGRRIKHLKTMFELAVSAGWIQKNPFEHLRGSAKTNHSRDFFIRLELAQEVLKACPDARWRLLFSFARWGGLRMPSEVSFLRWSDVMWDSDKIRIKVPKKTGRIEQERGNFSQRFIPIFPEIRTALEEYAAETGEKTGENDSIFPELDGSDRAGALIRKQFRQLLKRANIVEWPKLFNNLRATRDTELQDIYPLHKVCSWLGHTPRISLKHYAQMTSDDFRRASSTVSAPQTRTGENTGE